MCSKICRHRPEDGGGRLHLYNAVLLQVLQRLWNVLLETLFKSLVDRVEHRIQFFEPGRDVGLPLHAVFVGHANYTSARGRGRRSVVEVPNLKDKLHV